MNQKNIFVFVKKSKFQDLFICFCEKNQYIDLLIYWRFGFGRFWKEMSEDLEKSEEDGDLMGAYFDDEVKAQLGRLTTFHYLKWKTFNY